MRILFSLILLSYSFSAHAITPKNLDEILNISDFFQNVPGLERADQLGAPSTSQRPQLYRFKATLSDTYRIGDEWGKRPYSEKNQYSEPVLRMAQATARVGGATGFYLGEFAGRHVMATNYHVCESERDCLGTLVRFTALGRSYTINRFFGSWSDVDLALFTIDVPNAKDASLLQSVASPFDFSNSLYRGQPLATVGFGVGSNPGRAMVINEDSDCVVFSDANEFRFMADPDDLNPGPYKAWSFANGCDVSHGDSGSAMIDRETGQVVGIIWTGKIPKSSFVQSSKFLKDLLASPNEVVWKELSYAVPSQKIGDYLKELLAKKALPQDAEIVVSEMLKLN